VVVEAVTVSLEEELRETWAERPGFARVERGTLRVEAGGELRCKLDSALEMVLSWRVGTGLVVLFRSFKGRFLATRLVLMTNWALVVAGAGLLSAGRPLALAV
jgi:hypothetical protein